MRLTLFTMASCSWRPMGVAHRHGHGPIRELALCTRQRNDLERRCWKTQSRRVFARQCWNLHSPTDCVQCDEPNLTDRWLMLLSQVQVPSKNTQIFYANSAPRKSPDPKTGLEIPFSFWRRRLILGVAIRPLYLLVYSQVFAHPLPPSVSCSEAILAKFFTRERRAHFLKGLVAFIHVHIQPISVREERAVARNC